MTESTTLPKPQQKQQHQHEQHDDDNNDDITNEINKHDYPENSSFRETERITGNMTYNNYSMSPSWI